MTTTPISDLLSRMDLEQFEGHTPGPWRAYGRYIGTINHQSAIGECRDRNGNWSDADPASTNARLIAASPDLLQHARDLKATVERLSYQIGAEQDEVIRQTHIAMEQRMLADSLRARVAELEGALTSLVEAPALSGVRSLVAGWSGENRPEGPHQSRHPSRLGARIETNCGRIYDLDERLTAARAAIRATEGER